MTSIPIIANRDAVELLALASTLLSHGTAPFWFTEIAPHHAVYRAQSIPLRVVIIAAHLVPTSVSSRSSRSSRFLAKFVSVVTVQFISGL